MLPVARQGGITTTAMPALWLNAGLPADGTHAASRDAVRRIPGTVMCSQRNALERGSLLANRLAIGLFDDLARRILDGNCHGMVLLVHKPGR